jgi:hypothetical protein
VPPRWKEHFEEHFNEGSSLQIVAFSDCANICSRATFHARSYSSFTLYGSETWVLTKREENQLLVFKRKFLRTKCGPKIENGVYKRRYNHELDKEFGSPNALNVTKSNKIALHWSHDQWTKIKEVRNPGGRMG